MMTAKEYLEQVGNKEIYVRNLQKKIERLRKVLDSLGIAQHNSTKIENTHTLEKIRDLYTKIDKQQQLVDTLMLDLGEFKEKASDQIHQLNDERYKNILCEKYIELKTWKDIATDMKYNYNYLFHIHGAALNEFYRLYEQEINPEVVA